MPSPNQVFEANVRLSQDYLQLASSRTKDIGPCQRVAEAIRNAPIDIPAYYAEHGDLKGLRVAGIGPNTKPKLIPILVHGIEALERMNSTPVNLPLDKAVFQDEARAAVKEHRRQIREGE